MMNQLIDNIPVYEIIVDDNEEYGIKFISLVSNPAIIVKGVYLNKNFKFKIAEEKIIVAPVIIPDMKIYRYDDDIGEYYVFFSKNTIKKLVEKFNKNNSNRNINIEHKDILANAYILEDWIIESDIYDKSKLYGFNLPIGTYMVKIKIEDDKLWEYIKENEMYGLSIEGYFMQKMQNFKKYNINDIINNLTIDDIKNILKN